MLADMKYTTTVGDLTVAVDAPHSVTLKGKYGEEVVISDNEEIRTVRRAFDDLKNARQPKPHDA